jgi:CDP-diacylglycerol---glycerol-3-phosphate 3-phosphatidyltransferase
MSLAMILTWGRILLAPLFFILYLLAGAFSPVLLVGVWLVFGLIEISDLLDGHFARLLKQETEMGKVLDPFADSFSRLTYFIAFAGSGILPLWMLLIFVYRDISVAYIRVMTSREKVLMSARVSGKLKAWVYAFAGIGGLAVFSLRKVGWIAGGLPLVEAVSLGLFGLSAGVALWSLADYAVFFAKNFRKTS